MSGALSLYASSLNTRGKHHMARSGRKQQAFADEILITDVERRLMRAFKTLRVLPDPERKFGSGRSAWPEVLQLREEAYGYTEVSMPRSLQRSECDAFPCSPPTSASVDMLASLPWPQPSAFGSLGASGLPQTLRRPIRQSRAAPRLPCDAPLSFDVALAGSARLLRSSLLNQNYTQNNAQASQTHEDIHSYRRRPDPGLQLRD